MEKARNQNDLQFLLIFSYTYMYLLIKILRFLRVIFFHKFYFPKNERKINHCVVSFWMKNFLFNMNNKHLFFLLISFEIKIDCFPFERISENRKNGNFFPFVRFFWEEVKSKMLLCARCRWLGWHWIKNSLIWFEA